MRDIGSTRLPKPHHDLEEGEVSPFFRRDGGKFRRSPEEIEMRDVIGDLLQVLHFLFKGRYQDMGEYMRFGGDALSLSVWHGHTCFGLNETHV
jgi:hypothetical protein